MSRLRSFFWTDPEPETEDRLCLATRIGQLCEVLQAEREGSFSLSTGESRLAHSLVDALTGDLLQGRISATLATATAENLINRIRARLGEP